MPSFYQDNNISPSISGLMTNTAGNCLLAVYNPASIASTNGSINDTNGNNWAVVQKFTDANNQSSYLFIATNIKGGSNTITANNGTGTATGAALQVYEIVGILQSANALNAVDQSNSAAGSTTGPQITTGVANAFVFGSGEQTGPATFSLGAGWTTDLSDNGTNGITGGSSNTGGHQLVANSGTVVTVTFSPPPGVGNLNDSYIVSLKPAPTQSVSNFAFNNSTGRAGGGDQTMPYRPWRLSDLPPQAEHVINQGVRDIHAALDNLTKQQARRVGGTPTLTFGSIPAGNCKEAVANVPGANENLVAHANPKVTLGPNLSWSPYVKAGNQVAVRVCNPTSSPITPNPVRWNIVLV